MGELAAREGGTPPAGPHARAATPAELLHAIDDAIRAGQPPALRAIEQTVLDTLKASAERLPARAISDISGVALPATATTLASLHTRGLVTRRRNGRAWTYAYDQSS
ncbi:MAG: helix-turn-helix domain-containing protein [Micromonosporaceae bacterium]